MTDRKLDKLQEIADALQSSENKLIEIANEVADTRTELQKALEQLKAERRLGGVSQPAGEEPT